MKKLLLVSLCFLLLSITQVFAQNHTISGVVTAKEDGLSMPGVTVKVKGATTATQTNADGKYSITAAPGSTLTFSFIGYTTQEAVVGDKTEISIVLVQDSKQLNEVVVTALGIKKSEKSLGYSVSVVKGDDLVKSGEQNIIEGLAAKAPGVSITSSSGTPGASTKIILRGPSTFRDGANDPLIIIDGVPVDNSVNYPNAGDNPYDNRLFGSQVSNRAIDINPDDIESVSILQGPAAAALYGQRAGNGAIVYTTKRGNPNGLGVNFSTDLQLEEVSKLPKLQMQYGLGSDGAYSDQTANSFGEDLIAAKVPTFDNLKNFFKTGATYTNNISINGGNDKSSFRMAIGTSNKHGVIPYSDYNRYNIRLTGDNKLNDMFTVGGSVNFTNNNGSFSSTGSDLSGVMLSLLRMPADFDGRNYFDPETRTQINFFGSYDNPWFSAKYNPYNEQNNRVTANAYADAKLNSVFTLSYKISVDEYHTTDQKIYAYSSVGNDAADGTGQINRTNVDFLNVYSDLLLKFSKSFGASKNFSLNGLIGGNINSSQNESTYERGRDLAIPYFYNFSSAADLYVSGLSNYQNSKAVFADATIDYKSQIFLTLTGRNEWSSTFGEHSKGFFYPKADISYIFSSLLKNQNTISYGKVRFAYSNVGISPDVYSNTLYYDVPLVGDGFTNGFGFPYGDGSGGKHPGYAIGATIPDPDLKPERNVGIEAGLEMRFLHDLLGFNLTLYQQQSHALLIPQPVAPSSGFQDYYHNAAQMRNRGIEVSVTASPVKIKDFRWDIIANWSKNKNIVIKLTPGVTQFPVGNFFSDPQSYAIVGKPYGALFGYAFARDANHNVLIDPGSGEPIQETDQTELGDPNPTWLGNITNSFTYKKFSFSFLWDFRKGGYLWNGTWQNLNLRGKTIESLARNEDHIIPGVIASGPDAGKPNNIAISGTKYVTDYLGGGGATNELAIQSGSWIRLRSVNFAYRLDFAKTSSRATFKYVEFGLALRNIFLSTPYKGVDPETGLTGASANALGYDYYNNPGTKSESISLKFGL